MHIPVKISVVGEGHLADATAECCGKWFDLSLPEDAELVYFCVDTPVGIDDVPDVAYVMEQLRGTLRQVPPGIPVLISSQLPVGTCAKIEAEFPEHHLAMQPENIRKNHAVEDFRVQPRMIVGTRHPEDHELIKSVLSHFTPKVIFMSPESAEMTKHSINAFLALNIVFANEVADVCKLVGADIDDVFRGFRSDTRVGDGPLNPNGPYKGGTLGRDIVVLNDIHPDSLFEAIRDSNTSRL
jgi:UDPglucose 6-dehydrogenase